MNPVDTSSIGGLTQEQMNRMILEGTLGMADIGGMEKAAQAQMLRQNAIPIPKGNTTMDNLSRAAAIGYGGYQHQKGMGTMDAASRERKRVLDGIMAKMNTPAKTGIPPDTAALTQGLRGELGSGMYKTPDDPLAFGAM